MKRIEDFSSQDKKVTISELCSAAEVSRSGYYKHDFDKTSEDDPLVSSIVHYCKYLRERDNLPKAGGRQLYALSQVFFGEKMTLGRDKFFDILRANNLLLRRKKKSGVPRTTQGVVNHGFEDHVNKMVKYIPTDHCRLCVSDITYIKCKEDFYYLSLTMDAYSRIITGWSLQKTLATKGPLDALRQTVSFYKEHGLDIRGLIFHSDRGCQYISREMTDYEASLGIITSVTQTGDPLHNSMAERLNNTIKNDWLYNYEELSFEEAKEALAQAITMYNTARPHSGLGMKTPMQSLVPDYPNPLIARSMSKRKGKQSIHHSDAQGRRGACVPRP